MSNKTSRAQLTMLAETLRNAGYDAYEKNSVSTNAVTSRVVALGSSAGYARLVVYEQRGHKTQTFVYFGVRSTLDREFDNVDDAIRYFARTLRSLKPGLSTKTRDYPHHGEGNKLPLPNPSVFVVPEPAMEKKRAFFKMKPIAGGVYLEGLQGGGFKKLNNRVFKSGFIDVSMQNGSKGKNPQMEVDGKATMREIAGKKTLVNLFRQRGMWWWLTEPVETVRIDRTEKKPNGTQAIVSVHQKDHYFALRVEFETPVKLTTFPASGQPTLRPTTYAQEIVKGNIVGRIKTKTKEHPVYDRIVLR